MIRSRFFPRSALVCSTGLLLTLFFFIEPGKLQAQWSTNPNVNTPVCAAMRDQYTPTIVSDGAGGSIITWQDGRTGYDPNDIYAQRLNSAGVAQWTADGVAICTATAGQYNPVIVSDGAGGAIITWYDYRNGNSDIYAQRVNSSGAVQWTANGVAICTATGEQSAMTIVSDGSAGAIITWQDRRSATSYDIYAQRVSSGGAAMWTADGVAISVAANNQMNPVIVSDGSSGAIITWYDDRSGTNTDVYAQRINSAGTVQWTADGVPISTATYSQQNPAIVSDGAGGAIITWYDNRSGISFDIYAQRINSSGAVQWTADGVAVCTAAGTQQNPAIASDGASGAIITWYDYRLGNSNPDIYARRINSSGAVQWTADGVAICMAANYQFYPTIISDGSGGAIITWQDFRSGTNYDIYAQRVSSSGAVQWTADGIAISTPAYNQTYPTIVSDGSGGAIISWTDYRSGTNQDIYAQEVNQNGVLGIVVGVPDMTSQPLGLELYGNSPNPFGRNTVISYALPATQHVTLKVFNVLGREVATLVDGVENAGIKTAVFDAANLPSGIYTYRLSVLPEGAGADKAFVSVKKMLVLK